jgi:hypothetical protein
LLLQPAKVNNAAEITTVRMRSESMPIDPQRSRITF